MAWIGLNILYVERGYDFNINRLKKKQNNNNNIILNSYFITQMSVHRDSSGSWANKEQDYYRGGQSNSCDKGTRGISWRAGNAAQQQRTGEGF